jgi:phenylalanyl-tRNA synthetase beta chain
MLASLSWLDEFVPVSDLAPSFVADRLSMAGLEVEALSDFRAYLDLVVAARLLEAEPWGGLTRCLLDLGPRGRAQALCGAPGLALGAVYPLALMGAGLPGGPVRKMTAKGLDSEGMLCSAFELLLGEGRDSLLRLPDDAQPGTPLRALYPGEDWVLEVGVTPNRGDALSHLGIARDLAAILDRPLGIPPFRLDEGGPPASGQAAVRVECPDGCRRYCARVVNGAIPGPSPLWMARRLMSLGLRSINNVVDVTNYVMLELGLPLHAFDLAFLEGREIVVRSYGPGTRFTTLDGQERVLSAPSNVLICDRDRPVAIGGVMGGLNSEVTGGTRDVLLEGAMFDPASVRRTARSLGLSTDASFRFERGQDINMCPTAVGRAASLVASLTGGRVAPGLLDAHPRPFAPRSIAFSPDRCNRLLGTSYPAPEMLRALAAVGVRAEARGDGTFLAEQPSHRLDIGEEADLFEEVVRILDFDNLPDSLPAPPAPASPPPAPWALRRRLAAFMAGRGFLELVSYSFHNPSLFDRLGLAADDPLRAGAVPILNPLSEEGGVLRTSLIPPLLNAARLNQYHGQWDLALFELGAVFLSQGPGARPRERQSFAALLSGEGEDGPWCDRRRAPDFYDLKGVLEALSQGFLEEWSYRADPSLVPSFLDPGESAAVLRDGLLLGWLGLLRPALAKGLGLKESGGPVYLFELFPESLPAETVPAFRPFSQYPGVTRDMALVVDKGLSADELARAIRESGDFPLVSLRVFDVFEGGRLPRGKKSVAFRLFFQDPARTLNEALVGGFTKEILSNLEGRFQARLRDRAAAPEGPRNEDPQ